ncbi:MAG: beta-lactamase family protein [Deltaproteobacteria bacterium]|nr:beta-lactamase family protein [Deltaproteobacteria bacterium]
MGAPLPSAQSTTSTAAAREVPAAFEVRGPGKVTTAFGATLEVPDGFVASVEGRRVVLLEPDRKVEVYLFEGEGTDLAALVRDAWRAIDPAFAQPSEQTIEPPARDGWDAFRVESYPADPLNRVAQAVGRRKGGKAWVSLVRGKEGDLDKRSAQIRLFLGSLKAPGVEEPDVSKVEPKTIEGRTAELDAFIDQLLATSGTPGLQIAVVEQGRVIHAKGYGVKEIGKTARVDADTLMMIGSVTKSLTTLMMATLVDEGRLQWDAKAADVYPGFRLGDEALAKSLKVEDLVCACAGMPRKDLPLMLEFEKKAPEDVLKELSTLKPSTGLRETFQYQNHMVAAGGYVAAHAADPKAPIGRAYDQAMRHRVFEPLGMKRTTLDLDAAVKDKNHALPHSFGTDGKHRVVSLDHERFATFIRPSGGIWSSANEMARYVQNELAKGAGPSGKRVASEATLTHRWEKQVAISADVYYGLGWITAKTKGIRQITHGGGTMGFATLVSFFPDQGLGVVMISNGAGGHLLEAAIRSKLLELWFGIDDKSLEQVQVGLKTQSEALAKLAQECKPLEDALMKPLLGKHTNDELGTFEIKRGKDGYLLDAGAYQTRLIRHDRPDGKQALLFQDPPLLGLELLPLGASGEGSGGDGTLEITRAQERYVFRR